MNKSKRLRDLKKYYLKKEIFKSILTGFIFFIFPATLIIIITVNIVLLYVYYVIYFLLVIYIILTVLSGYTNKIVIITLKNYKDKTEELDYNHFQVIFTIASSIIILAIFTILFLIFL